MIEKQRLEERFDRIRQQAVDNDEPAAIVLADNRFRGESDLTVESFSIRDFIERWSSDEAFWFASEEARCYGKPVWIIDLVGGPFASEPDAFEIAWQSREYYYESKAQAEAA